MTKTKGILDEVFEERLNQDLEWGVQNHSATDWLVILAEEFGEVAKEACEIRFNRIDPANYRAELIQVAAVAVAAIEALDRGNQ